MENIIIVEGVKLDQEFTDILRRGERKEMMEYRNAIIDERMHRQNTWQKARSNSQGGDKEKLSGAFYFVILSIFTAVVAASDIRKAINDPSQRVGLISFAILFISLTIVNLARSIQLYFSYRGIDIEMVKPWSNDAKPGSIVNEMISDDTKYLQLRRDTNEILEIKQRRLDSMLGL